MNAASNAPTDPVPDLLTEVDQVNPNPGTLDQETLADQAPSTATPTPEAKPRRAKAKGKTTLKVGDVWELPQGANIVAMPDGTAVTARGQYGPLRQEGEHRAIKGGDVVATITVKG